MLIYLGRSPSLINVLSELTQTITPHMSVHTMTELNFESNLDAFDPEDYGVTRCSVYFKLQQRKSGHGSSTLKPLL